MKNIHQQLIEAITDYLQPYRDNYVEQCFEFEIAEDWNTDTTYRVEVKGYYKDKHKPEKQTPFILLRFFINYEWEQIQISNIFLPDFMRYQRIGKKLIGIIFAISEKEHYELYIVDMVYSFYNKMIERGALPCDDCDDAVQIVSETKLS